MTEFRTYNPATGEQSGVYPAVSVAEVACAVETARKAADIWVRKDVRERGESLERLRRSLAADADRLTAIVAREIGKPLQEAYGADLLPSLNALQWLTDNAPLLLREQRVPGKRQASLIPQALGVVGVIGTWNYPLFLNIAPIAWALAAGNTVVCKPSELAPETALALDRHFQNVGLPVTTLLGTGETGRALCRAGCDKIAFTGGVATGRAILRELANTGTPSVMELSGNDAAIVCADSDVSLAARSLVWGRCCNAGQSCLAPQRIYVAAEVHDAFVKECLAVLQNLRPAHDFGPLRTEALRERAHRLVWESIPQGAQLQAGGFALKERPGFYYVPTLLTDCTDALPVMAEDFFGPVLAVGKVRTTAEAVARANHSDMALAASVWTRNAAQGRQIANELRAGLVAINDILLDAAEAALPFGGSGTSGFGKQRGAAGLDEFVTWKVVAVHRSGGARRHLFPYQDSTLPILRGLTSLQAAQGFGAKLQVLRELGSAARQWGRNAQTPDAIDTEEPVR